MIYAPVVAERNIKSAAGSNMENNVKEIYNIFVKHLESLRNKQFNFLKVVLDNRQEENLNKLRHK
jgi:hypothetical protein